MCLLPAHGISKNSTGKGTAVLPTHQGDPCELYRFMWLTEALRKGKQVTVARHWSLGLLAMD